jgi:hypothetical protein
VLGLPPAFALSQDQTLKLKRLIQAELNRINGNPYTHNHASRRSHELMASRKKRRIRHYPLSTRHPKETPDTRKDNADHASLSSFPTMSKSKRPQTRKEPAITATKKAQQSRTRYKPGQTRKTLQRKRSRRKRFKAPAPMSRFLRPGPHLVNQENAQFSVIFSAFCEMQMTTISKSAGKQGFLRVQLRPAMPIGLAIHAA